jgi:vitamin B12 transporter
MFVEEFVVNAAFTTSSPLSATRTTNRTTQRTANSPRAEQLAKAAIDYHPMNMPFGLFASVNYVGRTFDTVGAAENTGMWLSISARGRFDTARHHRIDLNLFNADEQYATRLTRGFPDNGDPAYLVGNLGLPRTLAIHYTYNFF